MNLALSDTLPAAPAAAPIATERVLFALDANEREMFFPHGVPAIPGTQVRWRQDGELPRETWFSLLSEFKPTVIVSCWSTPAIPQSLAMPGSSLRYVCHLVGSSRSLIPRSFLERGGLLTNWGSIAGKMVAEHAMLLALSSLRGQPEWRQIIAAPVPLPWRSATMRLKTRTLTGRRVGLHGFGHVARALVGMLRAFDTEIFAYSSGVPDQMIRAGGAVPCSSLSELASQSEVFFDCEALNPRTVGSVDAAVLATLPDGAVFVNVGRGPVVDEAALLKEARSGRIHIALDVVTHEPLNESCPLTAIPGAVLSPHIGGPTHDSFPMCGQLALDNIARYLRGELLTAIIDLNLFDRST